MTLNAALDLMATNLERIHQSAAGAVEQLGKIPASIQLDGSSGPGDGEPFNPLAKGSGGQVVGAPRGLHYWQSGGGVDVGMAWLNDGQGGGARGGSGSRSGDWGGINIPGDSGRGGGGASGGRNDGPGGVGDGPQWTNLNAPRGGGVIPGAPGGPIILPPAPLPPAQSKAIGDTAMYAASMAADLSTIVRLLSAGGGDLPRDLG